MKDLYYIGSKYRILSVNEGTHTAEAVEIDQNQFRETLPFSKGIKPGDIVVYEARYCIEGQQLTALEIRAERLVEAVERYVEPKKGEHCTRNELLIVKNQLKDLLK